MTNGSGLGAGLRAMTLACLTLTLAACQTPADDSVAVETRAPDLSVRSVATGEANRLGRVHLAAGDHALAERYFREAVETNPEDAESWLGLAAAYDNLSRYELADRAYARVERLLGPTVEVINNRGYSYMLRGDGRRALAQFRRALSLSPDNVVVANNIRLLQLGQRPARATPL